MVGMIDGADEGIAEVVAEEVEGTRVGATEGTTGSDEVGVSVGVWRNHQLNAPVGAWVGAHQLLFAVGLKLGESAAEALSEAALGSGREGLSVLPTIQARKN